MTEQAIAKRVAGRPSIFSQDLADEICGRLEEGESLRSICRDDAMPARSTVELWVTDNPAFSDQYAKARNRGIDTMAEETLEIADDGTNDWMERQNKDGSTVEVVDAEHIQRSRLRVDTRKWYLSKLAPKRYGDMARIEHTGADGKDLPAPASIDTLEIARLLGFALRLADERRRAGDGAKVISPTGEAEQPEGIHGANLGHGEGNGD